MEESIEEREAHESASPPLPAVLGPTGRPNEIRHSVELDLLNVTKDLLIALVDVIESGSKHGAHTIIGWKDGSSSAIWEKNEAPSALGKIEQVDQITWVHAYAYYADGSSLHLRLMPRHQQVESIAESENSAAQQRLYRIRNLAQETDIPRNDSLPRVYRHRLAAFNALACVSFSASILILIGVFVVEGDPVVTGSLLAVQIAALIGLVFFRKKWPLQRPVPDAVVLRHAAGHKRRLDDSKTYIMLMLISTVIGAIAAVIGLFM